MTSSVEGVDDSVDRRQPQPVTLLDHVVVAKGRVRPADFLDRELELVGDGLQVLAIVDRVLERVMLSRRLHRHGDRLDDRAHPAEADVTDLTPLGDDESVGVSEAGEIEVQRPVHSSHGSHHHETDGQDDGMRDVSTYRQELPPDDAEPLPERPPKTGSG
jgi:hypothetical protein